MPTLNWIGKAAVEKHHQDVPYRLLEPVPELSCGVNDSGNLIVQGDNLHALKALLPRYAGQVKCIYIDPPYNTGMDDRDESNKRSGWIYSDNVNSLEIKQWLGKVVGAEAEDLSRHDKWLCMMMPRLILLKKFLREDGVIFISIDENEYGSLRLLMDEIFDISNRVGTIIWKNATDNNPTNIAIEHEYILCYARKKSLLPKEWKSPNLAVKEELLRISQEFIESYQDQEERQTEYTKWFRKNKDYLWPFDRYKFIDDGGVYTGSQSVHNPGKEGYRYDILHPITGKPCKQPLMGYRFPESSMTELLKTGRVIFGGDENKLIELKVYAKDYRSKLSSLYELDGRKGTNDIKAIFPEDNRPFDFPKPTELIEELISFVTSGNDIILDSFAGSGTTGQAVLNLNKADNQNRRFILVEMKPSIAENITQQRIKRVIFGYKNNKGLGGGFQFCRLSKEPLFTADGQVNTDVTFSQLAEFVWLTETKTGYTGNADSPLLGVFNDRAIYLLYNGILGDKDPDKGNVLTPAIFKSLPVFQGQKIIYATAKRGGDSWLKREQIIVKQTPYALGR